MFPPVSMLLFLLISKVKRFVLCFSGLPRRIRFSMLPLAFTKVIIEHVHTSSEVYLVLEGNNQ